MYKQIIIKPVVTEKSSLLAMQNKYVFIVNIKANKIQVRNEIEKMFNVKVIDVNTVIRKPKEKKMGKFMGMTKATKRAMISLKDGYKIDNFEKLS